MCSVSLFFKKITLSFQVSKKRKNLKIFILFEVDFILKKSQIYSINNYFLNFKKLYKSWSTGHNNKKMFKTRSNNGGGAGIILKKMTMGTF